MVKKITGFVQSARPKNYSRLALLENFLTDWSFVFTLFSCNVICSNDHAAMSDFFLVLHIIEWHSHDFYTSSSK